LFVSCLSVVAYSVSSLRIDMLRQKNKIINKVHSYNTHLYHTHSLQTLYLAYNPSAYPTLVIMIVTQLIYSSITNDHLLR